jgi:hypothetical protein
VSTAVLTGAAFAFASTSPEPLAAICVEARTNAKNTKLSLFISTSCGEFLFAFDYLDWISFLYIPKNCVKIKGYAKI